MQKAADILLRLGLALAFLYPPIDGWAHPFAWLGYVPSFAYILWPFSHLAFLHAFEVVEVILALWVLTGWKAWIPAGLMGILLVAIVAVNLSQFEVIFRDLSIAAAAFALMALHFPRRNAVIG